MGKTTDGKCPACGSEAIYRYGHIKNGKQRFRCMVCGRQYVLGVVRAKKENRPDCPQCGLKMHLYMHHEKAMRYRCSDYPRCKTYKKISLLRKETIVA
jgi:transposase-like protein